MTEHALPLDRPLPASLADAPRGLAAYRVFPVFSLPWLARRTALFALGFASFGTLVSLAALTQGLGPLRAALVASELTLGALAISTSGPLLATIVRHRGLARRLEQPLVIASLVLGLFVSFAADTVASDALEGNLGRATVVAEHPPAEGAVSLVINVVVLVILYGLFGGGLALRGYLDEPALLRDLARSREIAELRAKNQALDAHLGVLQAQIEPHFLFNALSSVRSLVSSDPSAAERAIDALATYLRATIPRLRGEVVESTLGQQLEIASAYLALMRARTGRLDYTVHIDPELASMPFPPLLIMSLVENAIEHGIEPSPGRGRVEIGARRESDVVRIRVEDDGVGLELGSGTGVGLANVYAHVRARYGENAGFTLQSRHPAGTTAEIVVPFSSETR